MGTGWSWEVPMNRSLLKRGPWKPGEDQRRNPVHGWYGLKKGLRGRFGMYIPPLMEALGLAEVTHEPKGNKMKSK